MAAAQTREKLLDALERIITTSGPGAVTLASVAEVAGVSKGGLLYHFKSKEELLAGLAARFRRLCDEDLEAARRSPDGVARYYLATSPVVTPRSPTAVVLAPASSTYLAVIQAAPLYPELYEGTRDYFRRWSRLLAEELADPVAALTVQMIGDGLYYNSVLGMPMPDEETLARLADRVLGAAPAR